MDESLPEGLGYSTIVTFRCARQFCLCINLLFLPLFNANFRGNTLPIMRHPKLNEEGERIFEISCANSGCFATSRCPIKFDLNCRLKNAFVFELYFTSVNLYTKSINTY